MALFGKKEKKGDKTAPKAVAKEVPTKKPKQSKPSKPNAPPDIYTMLLGLAALFFIIAAIVLGLNVYWYQSLADPAVLPLSSWAR